MSKCLEQRDPIARRGALLSRLSFCLVLFIGANTAASDDATLTATDFRMPGKTFSLTRMSDGKSCFGKPASSKDEFKLKVSCDSAAANKVKWAKLEAHPLAARKSADDPKSRFVTIWVDNEVYEARDHYFRMGGKPKYKPPPCSVFEEKHNDVAGTFGSGERFCDPNP